MADQPHREVGDAERRRQREHEQQQRNLDAPGRVDEQHVAVADAAGERERHRRGEYRNQPEQRPHQALLKPPRSRRDLKPRTASRLSVIDGGSKLIEADESCFICASAAWEALARASK